MLALAALDHVDLAASGRLGAHVLAAGAEQQDLGHVAEIEADAAPVRAAVLADLVPDDVGLVVEPPGAQDLEPLGQECVRHPEIAMRAVLQVRGHRQRADLVQFHRRIASEAFVFGRDLAGAVDEPPGRIGQNGAEPVIAEEFGKVLCGACVHIQHDGRSVA